jgi:hypothetical protein
MENRGPFLPWCFLFLCEVFSDLENNCKNTTWSSHETLPPSYPNCECSINFALLFSL